MRNHRRVATAIISAAAVSLVLSGCAGSDTAAPAEPGKLESVTWMTILHTPTTPESSGPVETALEELTGTDITFQWVPDASKDEKINAVLASDSLAEITSLTNSANASVRTAISSGQFWDVEPYLDQFENLSKIDKQTIAAARVGGHLYGIPYQKPKARYGVIVRQDWLDNLGLEVPHTVDDLAKVALAFTNDDPDGNGKNDTTGFIDRAESQKLGFRMLSGFFGSGDRFTVTDDDKIVPAFTTDEYKEAMQWYRDLYQQGAVNNEFVTVQKQNQYDAIAQSKGGIVVTGLFEASTNMANGLAADPNTPMKWALINDMTAGDSPRAILSDTAGGFGGWLAISTSKVKSEEQLLSILAFIDKLLVEDAYKLMTYGVEGEHYEQGSDGVIKILDQTVWEQEVQPYNGSRPNDTLTFKSTKPYADEANKLIAENAEFAVVDPTLPLTSETYNKRWSVIDQGAIDAYNKFMVGQLDMAGFEKAIDALGSQGLDAVLEEFTASYAEQKKG